MNDSLLLRKKVFLDTEFTNLLDPVLISIGLAADSGETFCAEVPVDLALCMPFVREAVLPQLGRNPLDATTWEALSRLVTTWLEIVKDAGHDIDICFDSQTDWDLMADVMDYRTPPWIHPQNVAYQLVPALQYAYLNGHGCSGHHALQDALANLYAYRDSPNMESKESQ